jgi:hypothetical protein
VIIACGRATGHNGSVVDPGVLGTVASVTAGFGVAVLLFRIQRELDMQQQDERNWIPWADWLLFISTITALVVVLLPLVLFPGSDAVGNRLPTAGCAAMLVAMTGYVVGILAHYRLIFGSKRSGPRDNPEPSERVVVLVTIVGALVAFAVSLITTG